MSSSRFSGDTVPSDPLICAGLNATLLIHEASMADDEKEMATIKQHSTFGQAVDVGRE
jgi:ribonuclease Z